MNKEIIFLLVIIIIIFFMFYSINVLFNDNNENFGVYCGRYNINKATAQINCSADTECYWNPYTSHEGIVTGWCGQNPDPMKSS